MRRLLKAHGVVRRRSVSRRERRIVEPQVDPELRPMMYQMIQEHLPVCQKARAAEDGLPLKTQLPRLSPGVVGSILQRLAHFGRAFVERLGQLLRRFECRPGSRSIAKVQLGSGQDRESKAS